LKADYPLREKLFKERISIKRIESHQSLFKSLLVLRGISIKRIESLDHLPERRV